MEWTAAQAAALDENVRLIEAGAGAGKTAVLVEAYLRRLRSSRVGGDPNRMLALTFSEKAAAEMKSRIQQAIGHDWLLRFKIEAAPISTIHAFASQVIGRYYDHLGLTDPPAIIQGPSAAFLQSEAIDMTIVRLKNEKSPELLSYLIDTPESTLRADLAMLFKKSDVALRWLDAYQEEPEVTAWLNDVLADVDAHHTQMAYQKLVSLGGFFRQCWAVYGALKRAQGRVDFDDLLRLAITAIRLPDVAAALHAQYPVVLVDEFQDTGTAEWELIKAVSGTDDPLPSERLLVVGDVKQSIYGFKGAQPGRMTQMIAACRTSLPHAHCMLADNFRSLPAIVEFVNGFFAQAFQTAYGDFRLTYQPINCRQAHAPGAVGLAMVAPQDIHAAIRTQVRRLIQNGYRYSDIAILVRQKSSIDPIRKALVTEGIPVLIHAGQGFFQRQEVVDVLMLIQVLSRPDDAVAWVGMLASPWIGISDDSIAKWVENGEGWEAMQNLDLPPVERERVVQWVARFGRWEMQRRVWPLSAVLLMALEEMGWFGYLQQAEDGPQKVANLHKLIQMVAELEQDAQMGLLDLEHALTHHVLQRTLEPDEPASDGIDAVKIMTVHAAKGLEFPAVVLPGLEIPFHFGKADRIYLSEAHGMAMSLGSLLPGENRLRTQIRDRVVGQALDEELRLFYVGCTRAKETLVLIAGSSEFPNA
ncbi:MAG: ATP-dependent helicase, partial [Candidatus Margulisiibacteriota bacterium]